MKKMVCVIMLIAMLLSVVGCSDDIQIVEKQNDVVSSETINNESVTIKTEIASSESEYTYKLTDTGQNKSYDAQGNEIDPNAGDAFYGQDAQYDGDEASFTDNGNGTITDNVTGLIWQQVPVSENMSWEEAIEYCENLELAGYDSWRTPTVKELFGISDFTTGWPFLDTDYFEFPESSTMMMDEDQDGAPQDGVPQDGAPQDGAPQDGAPQGGAPQGGAPQDGAPQDGAPQDGGAPQGGAPQDGGPQDGRTETSENADAQNEMPPPSTSDEEGSVGKQQGQFWSSNYYYVGTTHGGANTAFGVNQATGHIKGYPSDVGGQMGKYVRAVVGDVTAENQFVDNGDGTISDLATGLMWMTDDNGEGVEWEEALSYSENLESSGYDDWRLPDVKELQSIVDYSGVYPAIEGSYFNCTELEENVNYYYWTSTSAYFSTVNPTNYYAWYVAFGYAVGNDGEDSHGAGAVRFSAKYGDSEAEAEGGDNFLNSVRCVRNID